MDDCPRCQQPEQYGCGCTTLEIAEWRKNRIVELESVVRWYGEQATLARLIHSEGDKGRHALAADGGKTARETLKETP
jgi:hypothetical protein